MVDEEEQDREGVEGADQESDGAGEEEVPPPPRTRARQGTPSVAPPSPSSSPSSTHPYRCPWDDYSASKSSPSE